MPKLYLAKVNLNSKIFSVYDEELNIEEVMGLVYDRINQDVIYKTSNRSMRTDSMGNSKFYSKVSKYSFAELKKDSMVVTGKILRSYTKFNDVKNEETNKIETISNEDSVSIRFYFNVQKEMLTFCERQCFGYNQFTDAFNHLLNKCVKDYEFETFLQKDSNKLEEKIKELHKITRVKAVIIPPNPNSRNVSSIKERCINMNSTKITSVYESEDLIMESEEMEEIKEYVSAGYGDLTATGVNKSGRIQNISSSQDAAYSCDIEENLDDESYNEEAENLIISYEKYRERALKNRRF